MITVTQVGEFETLSIPPKTKGTAYETTANRLTENSRKLLTVMPVFKWHQTFDIGVNSLRERDSRPGRWHEHGAPQC